MEIRKQLSPRGVLKEDNLVIHSFHSFFFGTYSFFGLYFTFSLLTLLSFSLLPTNTHSSDLAVTMSSITRARVFLPPQKSEQAASAGRGTDVYTHTCEFLARGFGGTGQSFLSPTTLLCFIVNYPWSVTWISVSVFLHEPPLRPPPTFLYSNPDRKEVPVALNVTVQVNLCPAVTASIEGCLSSRILTNYHFKS